MQWLSQGNIDFKTAPWPSISAAAKDCVRKLLTMDPKLRPTAQQILEVHSHSQCPAPPGVSMGRALA